MTERHVKAVRLMRLTAPGPMAVLFALASHADENGKAFPSQRTLAEEAGLRERHVRRILAMLEARGWVNRSHRYAAGHRSSDCIELTLPTLAAPRQLLLPLLGLVHTGHKRPSYRSSWPGKNPEKKNLS